MEDARTEVRATGICKNKLKKIKNGNRDVAGKNQPISDVLKAS